MPRNAFIIQVVSHEPTQEEREIRRKAVEHLESLGCTVLNPYCIKSYASEYALLSDAQVVYCCKTVSSSLPEVEIMFYIHAVQEAPKIEVLSDPDFTPEQLFCAEIPPDSALQQELKAVCSKKVLPIQKRGSTYQRANGLAEKIISLVTGHWYSEVKVALWLLDEFMARQFGFVMEPLVQGPETGIPYYGEDGELHFSGKRSPVGEATVSQSDFQDAQKKEGTTA